MNLLLKTIKDIINQAFRETFPELPQDFDAEVTRATNPQFGHYQCNSALSLAKKLQQNPRTIAQALIDHINSLEDHCFDELSLAGPGFINMTIHPRAINQALQCMNVGTHFGAQTPDNPQRIVIDFSSPNVAKEMHVGHLRSTIIGDCLARVLEWQGHDVLRLNHVGDWGTAFGMLIAYLKDTQPDVLAKKQNASLTDLMDWYRASKRRFDEDEAFKEASRLQVVALQSGDQEALSAWKLIGEISYKAYHQVYTLLDITLTDRGESFYNPMLQETVDLLREKDLLTESRGAQCVFMPGYECKNKEPMPVIVQKSDGGFNYSTTDLAAIRHRVNEENAERIVYVTDQGQQLHFKMIFDCAKRAGFAPDSLSLEHVPFGLVLGDDGKKLKTRSGHVEKLVDLLQEAIDRAYAIMESRHPDWDKDHMREESQKLGLAAVKYADLSNHRQSDYQFSYDKMLAFEGNTAAFILYSIVRIISIEHKSQAMPAMRMHVNQPESLDLALHLLNFTHTLDVVARDLTPNRLTDYLYQLAMLFNRFFHNCPVIGDKHEADRLALIGLTKRVLIQGLNLLGIRHLDEM